MFILRPPSVDVDGLPRLIPFKYATTEDQVFTHRSYFARCTTVFEDPPNNPAPDNEMLEYIGDSVLSMAIGLLTKRDLSYVRSALLCSSLGHPHYCLTAASLRVGPHAVSHPCHSFQSVLQPTGYF